MIIQNVKNIVKNGQKELYIQNAKAFANDLTHNEGCIAAGDFDGREDNEVSNISVWNSSEAMNSQAATQIFLNHKSSLKPYFISNTAEIIESL